MAKAAFRQHFTIGSLIIAIASAIVEFTPALSDELAVALLSTAGLKSHITLFISGRKILHYTHMENYLMPAKCHKYFINLSGEGSRVILSILSFSF